MTNIEGLITSYISMIALTGVLAAFLGAWWFVHKRKKNKKNEEK